MEIRFSESMREMIERLREGRGESVTALIRRLVFEEWERKQKKTEAA